MEFDEVVIKRTSIRKFTNEPVKDEEINELMKAAMSAPSAMDKRPWNFYVIKDKDKLNEIKTKGSKWCNYNAPLAIVVTCSLTRTLPLEMKEFWVQDCSAATNNILLKAVDLGLGGVWCGVYPIKHNVKNVKKILGLGINEIPLNIIMIGHPDGEINPKDKFDESRIHII